MNETKIPAVKLACEINSDMPETVKMYRSKMKIRGYSENTISNYTRHLAYVVISTGKLPDQLTISEVEDYLYRITSDKNFSLSFYKHLVGGLSLYYTLFGCGKLALSLPSVPERFTLPVVLSGSECKKIFMCATSLRNRVILMFLYSAGLRSGELENLKWEDINTDRKTILVKATKNNSDRILALSDHLCKLLKQYRKLYKTNVYILNGRKPGEKVSKGSLQAVTRQAVALSGIEKRVTCHTFRHTFATHMLEEGYDIVTIKELLGHKDIYHTLRYTHLVYIKRKKPVSPLDLLYKKNYPPANNKKAEG
jgi:site-specific recombinase XerD